VRVPNPVAQRKIADLQAQGYERYSATALRRGDTYVIVGDGGNVRWSHSEQERVPDGWKMMPNELADEALYAAWRDAGGHINHETLRHLYRTMIEAAPTPEEFK
jgi:hypothetical protein